MAMLEINHLQKKFGTTEVLRDVSLSVSKGDVVAILGPSGSGKDDAAALRRSFWNARTRANCSLMTRNST